MLLKSDVNQRGAPTDLLDVYMSHTLTYACKESPSHEIHPLKEFPPSPRADQKYHVVVHFMPENTDFEHSYFPKKITRGSDKKVSG